MRMPISLLAWPVALWINTAPLSTDQANRTSRSVEYQPTAVHSPAASSEFLQQRIAVENNRTSFSKAESDCNQNGISDSTDIANGQSQDCNGNQIPDECEIGNPIYATAEDNCEDAQVIRPNHTYVGTNAGASSDGEDLCSGSEFAPDVWYQYRPTDDGTATVSLCGSPFNTGLSVHTSCPGTFINQIACNDDFCGLASQVSFAVEADHVYFIRITGYAGLTGQYQMILTGPAVHAAVNDCNANEILDECEADCNRNGTPDECDIDAGDSIDLNLDGIPDECADCDNNGIPDSVDIQNGADDCDFNGVLDECQADGDHDGLIDLCDPDDDDDGIADDGDGSGLAGDYTCGNGITTLCDDNCPNIANADQTDSDGDGWGDRCDTCPGTLPGVRVDDNGCSTVRADMDGDGDVDLEDFGLFQACLTDRLTPISNPRCQSGDLDEDGNVDQDDIPYMKRYLTGSKVISTTLKAASRTNGVAPLLVFFDAIDSATGVTQPDDGDHARLHYEWDFGDPGSGVWSTTGNSRNRADGYCAAHVFQNPGHYTVKLLVTTPDRKSTAFEQTITVTAFTGSSCYVSRSSGNDDWDGEAPTFEGGQRGPLKSLNTALARTNTHKQILFKRGDCWTEANGVTIQAPGPGIIGAYGTGDPPTITMIGTGPLFLFRNADDWRIMDLHLIGPATGGQFSAIEGESLRQNLALALWITGFRTGIGHGWEGPENHTENGIVDCLIEQAEINNVYAGGRKLAILGNRIERSIESHLVRLYHVVKGVISNNGLYDPGGDRLSLKLHNEYALTELPESSYIVFSENQCQGQIVVTAIGPQQEIPIIDERLRDIIYEKNTLYATTLTEGMAQFACRRATIRNNIFVCTGCSRHMQFVVRIWQASGEPIPNHIRVYNNSAYMADDCLEFTFALVTAGTDITIRNNMAVTPMFTGYLWQAVDSSVAITADHNLLTRIQNFVDPDAMDFRLVSGSIGREGGWTLPEVYDDFTRTPRPQSGGFDLGATEQ